MRYVTVRVKTPNYIREGDKIHTVQSELDAFGRLLFRITSTKTYESISKAKKASAELQKGQMGSGVVRTHESIQKGA